MIREYRDADLDRILEVWLAASKIAHPFLTEEFLANELKSIRDVHIPKAVTWVYEDAGRVVGFIALIDNEVGAVFVSPEMQRRGIGRALMDLARDQHATLELDVFEANSIGRAFYERYGFVQIGRHIQTDSGQPCLRLRYGA
ncbi:MAG: GNAT family N-acetyltransferase [Gemmatimonadota bacterium]|nr:MAG: GNAT family N-acetyltransferase [Gemmatimonadota bacterium]